MILLSHQHLPLDHLEISAHIHAYINLAYYRTLLLHNETVIVISAELVNHTISLTYKSDKLKFLSLQLRFDFEIIFFKGVIFVSLIGKFGLKVSALVIKLSLERM